MLRSKNGSSRRPSREGLSVPVQGLGVKNAGSGFKRDSAREAIRVVHTDIQQLCKD